MLVAPRSSWSQLKKNQKSLGSLYAEKGESKRVLSVLTWKKESKRKPEQEERTFSLIKERRTSAGKLFRGVVTDRMDVWEKRRLKSNKKKKAVKRNSKKKKGHEKREENRSEQRLWADGTKLSKKKKRRINFGPSYPNRHYGKKGGEREVNAWV